LMAHCDIDAVPSAHGVPICTVHSRSVIPCMRGREGGFKFRCVTCLIPCQWMTTPSVCRWLFTTTTIRSPALAVMVGPGNVPLIPIIPCCRQSGAHKMYSTSHVKCRVVGAGEAGRAVGAGAGDMKPRWAGSTERASRSIRVQRMSRCCAAREPRCLGIVAEGIGHSHSADEVAFFLSTRSRSAAVCVEAGEDRRRSFIGGKKIQYSIKIYVPADEDKQNKAWILCVANKIK
jgi:hypothetical protein